MPLNKKIYSLSIIQTDHQTKQNKMSIVTLKRKTMNKYPPYKISGKPPGGFWMNQGPFGLTTENSHESNKLYNFGPEGFSINGSRRLIPVGKSMKMSKNGTKFKGIYATGYGGHNGRYYHAEPVLNAGPAKIEVMGNQWEFVKPGNKSNKAMINNKFRWIQSGQYPNNVVQPIYTGNQTDTASQGMYLHDKTCANDCVVDTNDPLKYVGFLKNGCGLNRGSTFLSIGCATYTKYLHIPQTQAQHMQHIQRKCTNPTELQKPYPPAKNTGTGILTGGITVSNVGSSCHPM